MHHHLKGTHSRLNFGLVSDLNQVQYTRPLISFVNKTSHRRSRTDVIAALVAGAGNMTGARHTSARIRCLGLLKKISDIIQTTPSLKEDTAQLKRNYTSSITNYFR